MERKKKKKKLPSGDRGRCGPVPAGDAKRNWNYCDLFLSWRQIVVCFYKGMIELVHVVKVLFVVFLKSSTNKKLIYEIYYYPKMKFKIKMFIIRANL